MLEKTTPTWAYSYVLCDMHYVYVSGKGYKLVTSKLVEKLQ